MRNGNKKNALNFHNFIHIARAHFEFGPKFQISKLLV